MVVFASSLLDSSLVLAPPLQQSSLVLLEQRSRRSTVVSQAPSSSSSSSTRSSQTQTRKSSSAHFLEDTAPSWIPFLFKSAQKNAAKPPINEAPSPSEAMAADLNLGGMACPEELLMAPPPPSPKKRPSKGHRTVLFTPQKALELRNKLKGTDSFHDFMYHSAIASRLASQDR